MSSNDEAVAELLAIASQDAKDAQAALDRATGSS